MGKAKVKSPTKPATMTPEVQAKVNDLRAEAQQLFLKKDFSKAADVYDAAVKALPEGASEKAELWQKKIGCLLNGKKYKEAAKEATAVLELVPGSPSVLKSRAKAYEQQGLWKQALADVQLVNRSDVATAETRDMEKRLKDAVAGRRDRPLSAPTSGSTPAARSAASAMISIKATLGSETKLLALPITSISYAQLLVAIRSKFPTAGPVVLKFVDKEGDLVTITSTNDIQVALTELLAVYQRQLQGQHSPKLIAPQPPALKISVVPVASDALVPPPPPEEIAAVPGAKEAGLDAAGQPAEVPEEWLMNFVRLFTDVTGIDPSAHAESWHQANEKLQRAMQDTVHAAEAEPLFEQAGEHYRDAIVSSLIQWGNVSILKADRVLHALRAKAVKSGSMASWGSDAGLTEVLALYDKTEAKIREALAVRADSWEAVGSLAQLEWERAKAKMGYVLPLAKPAEEGTSAEAASQEANKSLLEALGNITKANIDKARAHVEKANEFFTQALDLAHKSYAAKKAAETAKSAKEASSSADSNGAPAADEPLPVTSAPSNVLIMHGNTLYDWSQVLAAAGEAWREVLDSAAVKFRASGAAEVDVRAALKNHTRHAELDLGPDPEPEAPATPTPAAPTPAPAAEKKAAPEAKGLPSLDRKKAAKK